MRLHSLHQKARLSAALAIDQLRTILAKSADGTVTHHLDLSELEDRILLSASPAAVMVDSAPAAESAEIASPLEATPDSLFESPPVSNSDTSSTPDEHAPLLDDVAGTIDAKFEQSKSDFDSTAPIERAATEVIFVDEAAEDFEALVADLQTQRDAGRAIDFFVLDSHSDGVDQIAETLERYSDLDAVHIVSHGADGGVKLGATWLRIGSLDGYAGAIAGWGSAFNADGDLLFYGCDLASNTRGEMLVHSIAALSGADVAASTDDTGHAIFGGDWELEYQVGQIETQVVVTETLQSNWGHLLNVTVDSTSTGTAATGAGSVAVNHTTSGTDRLMLVGVSFGQDKGDTVSSITYNGVNLTLVGARDHGNPLQSRMEIWSLVAPTVSSADVVVTFSGTSHIGATVGVMTFNGVDQTTALGSFASSEGDSSTPSTTVTSAPGELVFGVLGLDWNADMDLIPGPGQTEHWDLWQDKATGGGTTEAGAASVDISWTLPSNYKWAAGGVSIKPTAVNVALASKAEFRVNSTSSDVQETSARNRGSHRAVAIAPSGDYVVVWSSNNQDSNEWGVYGQRYDKDGTAQGSEFSINQTTSRGQQWATVAMDDDGGFIAVWSSEGQDGDNPSETNVYARRYNATGTALSNEFLVNTTTTNSDQYNASIAMDADGDFVIVWEGNGVGDGHGIFGQRYDADGSPQGGEFLINDLSLASNQRDVAASMDDNGNFVVVWDDLNGFHAKLYDNTGTSLGGQFSITTDATAGNGSVAMDANGDFVAVWRQDGFGKAVWARRYDSSGSPLAAEFRVNSTIVGDQTHPSVSIDGAGNFVVVWEGNGDQAGNVDADGVFGQKFDATGTKIGGEFLINNTTTSGQNKTSVAMLDTDNFVVVWSGNGEQLGDVDANGVFARQFGTGASGNSAPSADPGGLYVINEGDSLNLIGSGSSDPDLDTLLFAWDLDNDGNYGEAGEPVTETPTVSWATLQGFGIDDDGVFIVGLQVDDGNGGVDTATTTITVNDVAPILSTSGSGTVFAGSSYTLNLSASDPGADTISSWTINWGDGTIETFVGNPSTAIHTFTAAGFTFNILASATDEDGTHFQNELLVASSKTDSVIRYGTAGEFLQEFAIPPDVETPDYPVDTIIGPDGNLYVSGWNSDDVLRYDATTGAFIDEFVTAGSNGLDTAAGLAFGPDGNLYVASRLTSEVLRFNGTTGAFIDAFVIAGSGGLNEAEGLAFGPDGHLYVSDYEDDKVFKYDGTTGVFLAEFVTNGSGGLNFAEDLTFGPDNNLYVADNNSVIRYNGTTGAFIDKFVSNASGGLNFASGLVFGPDGHLYVGSWGTDNVLRYDGTTGAFIDEYISAGSGGLAETDYLTFLPEHQVTVTAVPNSPPTADPGGPYVINEGDSLTLAGSASSDPDTDPLTFAWDLDNDGNYGEAGEPTTETPTVSWATLQSFGIDDDPGSPFTIGVQVDDGNGGVNTAMTTVTVNNVSPTASADSGTGFSSNEDTSFKTGSVLTNDSDQNSLDVLSVTGLDDTGTVGLVTDNGDGTFNYAPNGQFELLAAGQQTTDTFSYTVSDDDGGTSMATVSVMIDGVNDAPTDISLDNLTINEAMSDAVVGNLTTTDVDTGDSHTYSVDDTRFEVIGSQLKLKAGQSLDFETEPTVSLTITTTDSGTASFNKPFAISVSDVNEAPSVSLSQTSDSLAENVDTSSAIVLVSVSVTDDALGSNSLTLSGTDAVSFEIVGGNLRLKAGTPLDFETQQSYAVTVEVNDPFVGSSPDDSANFTLTITDIDESPVVTTSAGTAAFTEDAGAGALDSGLTVSDPENAGLSSAEVRFDSGFVAGQDDLLFTNQSGISGSYNATSGILTLSGTASVATYETAIRSVTYSNSSQNPNTGNRVVRFMVNDGSNVATATRTLTVTAQDDTANVITGGPYSVAEGGNVSLDGSASNDIDNFIVEYAWDFDYDGVTFSADASGSTTNFSAATIDGPDTRTVALRVRSDNGVFALATATVTISNVVPTANADSGAGFSTDEDSAFVTGNVLSNDSDPGPESLTVSSFDTTGTVGQVIDRGDGTFTYNSNGQFENLAPGQSANDTFTYTVTDGIASNSATVTILINGANDAPIAADQNVSVDENAALNALVATAAATDVDADDSVSWTIISGNTNGAFSINSTSGEVRVSKPLELNFETSPNYSLTVRATDGNGGVDTATITVSLNDLNEAPTAGNAIFGLAENSANGTVGGSVPATDPDASDLLSWTIVGGNTAGAFTIDSSNGQVSVANSAALDFETNPTFNLSVRVQDAGGAFDATSVDISLVDQNEAPTADNSVLSVDEDAASGTSIGVLAGSDPDAGDTRSWSILSGNTGGAFSLDASTGELSVASPSTLNFETTPTYTLNVQIQDAGGLTDSAVVVVNVSDVNEAPTTTGLADVAVNEDSANVVVNLKTAFSDVETPSAALSYSIVGNSNSALFSRTPIVGGNLILKFAPNANGNAIVAVRATDPQGAFVTTAFNVMVAPTADAPASTPDSYVVFGEQLTVPPAGGVLANDSDPDGDAISALLVSGPANGSLVLLSNGGFTYTPDAEFTGIDTFIYEPFDGTSTGP